MESLFAALVTQLEAYLRDTRRRRNEARTRMFLAQLPDDLRKDIGWPDGRTVPAPLKPKASKWDAEGLLARTAAPAEPR